MNTFSPAEMFVLPSASRAERAPMPIDGKTEDIRKKWETPTRKLQEKKLRKKSAKVKAKWWQEVEQELK